MSDNLKTAITALLLLGVGGTAFITILRQYSTAFMMVDPSREYSLIAAFMVVGIMALTLLLPTTPAIRFAFWTIGAAIIMAMAVAVAPRLGLIEHSPLSWRYALLAAVVSPFAGLLAMAWGAKPKAAATTESAESGRKPPKVDRNPLRLSRKQKALMSRKPPKALADSESGGQGESAESLMMLNETLEVVRQHRGNMAAAARQLNLTPPGVGDRLRRLYKEQPEQVERYAPEWVKRNIKE